MLIGRSLKASYLPASLCRLQPLGGSAQKVKVEALEAEEEERTES